MSLRNTHKISLFLSVFITIIIYSFGQSFAQAKSDPLMSLVNWELNANQGLSVEDKYKYAEYICKHETIDPKLKTILIKTMGLNSLAYEQLAQTGDLPFSKLDNKILGKLISTPFHMEYLEVPESLFDELNISAIDTSDPLFFQSKNDKKIFRYFIHPLQDKSEMDNIVNILKESKVSSAIKHVDFPSYFSASRSVLFRDPENNEIKSIKMSIKKAAGKFKNKQLTAAAAENLYHRSQVMSFVDDTFGLKHGEVLDEPQMVSVGGKGQNEGFLVRSYKNLKSGRYYLPAFSALDPEIGTEIASLNGYTDPNKFWKKNLLTPLADALAELYAYTDFTYNSPHSQNFLIELDEFMKPTGKIIMKDFDFYIDPKSPMFSLERFKHLKDITKDGSIVDRKELIYMLTNGLHEKPDWLDNEKWAQSFFNEFHQKLDSITSNQGDPTKITIKRPYFIGDPKRGDIRMLTKEDAVKNEGVLVNDSYKGMTNFREDYSKYKDSSSAKKWRFKILKEIGVGKEQAVQLLKEFPEYADLLNDPDRGFQRILQGTNKEGLFKLPREIFLYFKQYNLLTSDQEMDLNIKKYLKKEISNISVIDKEFLERLTDFAKHIDPEIFDSIVKKVDPKSKSYIINRLFLSTEFKFPINKFPVEYFQRSDQKSINTFLYFVLKSHQKDIQERYSSWLPQIADLVESEENIRELEGLLDNDKVSSRVKLQINNKLKIFCLQGILNNRDVDLPIRK